MTVIWSCKREGYVPVLKESIPLDNGLVLEAWDMSRHIAGDRSQVVLACRIPVDVSRRLFPLDDDGLAAYEEFRREFGTSISWEFLSERNFVARQSRVQVWEELFRQFRDDSLRYLSHPRFAERFVLSILGKLRRNPIGLRTERSKSIFGRSLREDEFGESEASGEE